MSRHAFTSLTIAVSLMQIAANVEYLMHDARAGGHDQEVLKGLGTCQTAVTMP